jgi:hypothetical protein
MEVLTKADLVHELGLVGADGVPSARAIAKILRSAMARWGLCPRRALLSYAREELRAGDVPTDSVPDVLARLLELGECAEVVLGHEPLITPATPRWIDLGGGQAVLLGPVALPSVVAEIQGLPPDDLLVRVHLEGEEQAAVLEASGAHQTSLEEWLHPLGYLQHVVRRKGEIARVDQWCLALYWEHLVSVLAEEGLLLGSDAEIRAVVGSPGAFFGSYRTPKPEGRWTEQPPEGVWCAYRQGHGEGRWLPTLVAVAGDERRALDLYDHDEWRWALLARSKAVGPPEVYRRTNAEEHVTWPLPAQLKAAMNIIGVPAGPWRWRVAQDAPSVWSVLK